MHGEWVRIHPFADGTGRTARIWVTWLLLRYGLPTFVTLEPRPTDTAYARAARVQRQAHPRTPVITPPPSGCSRSC
ncbi:MAG: Fic family protein [Actinomycetes bacterium]